MLSVRTAHDFLGPSHGQRIQTGAFFRVDGAGGVCRVWSYIVLHSSDERAAYAIGLKVGEQAPPGATLPTATDLNMMAQKYFKQQGSGNQQNWDQGFENGYTAGFNKTHPRQ
jgi:hypothetical protein